jgi:hypothetical protein
MARKAKLTRRRTKSSKRTGAKKIAKKTERHSKKRAPTRAAKKTPTKSATKKKAATRSKKGGSTGRPAAINVGILSGIPFTNTSYQRAFERGLGSTPLYLNPEERLGYSAASFNAALARLNNIAQLNLIIAIGGIVAELPATANMRKNTISLVGGAIQGSANPGGRFHGRINLESFHTNPARFNHLRTTFGIQRQEICLLANPNSAMASTEHGGGFGQVVHAPIDETTTMQQALTAYTRALAGIDQNRRAVIVSADPWFTQTRAALVQAANNWAVEGKRVCYPLQEYGDASPNRGRTTLYGPSLDDAYFKLGQLAANLINPANPAPGQPRQDIHDI